MSSISTSLLTDESKSHFFRRILIYIPTYNVESRIVPLIDEIPSYLWDMADIFVLDNCSRDNTVNNVNTANAEKRWPREVPVLIPKENLGYSGSQKMAYTIALQNPNAEAVLMLHGDGQYDPHLIKDLFKYLDTPYQVVYGYRSWLHYFRKDETPISSYITIKVLSLVENLMTGIFRKEWHSGFVMYKRQFLSQVNFDNITRTMHIDGHLHFAAGKMKAPVIGVPIYKRYKNYPALGLVNRVGYVFDVLALLPRLHFIPVVKKKCEVTDFLKLSKSVGSKEKIKSSKETAAQELNP